MDVNPNFFLAGTAKAGTSSLHLWLRQHPEVGTPIRKEMHFFCSCPNPKLRVADSMEEYLAAFPSGRAVGESSPCYLYYPATPHRLADFAGARIIISLRDPVERFWSHYLMNEVNRPSAMAPLEFLEHNLAVGRSDALNDLFGMGLYGEQVARYLEVFGEDRMLLLFLEETALDPQMTMQTVARFLDLDDGYRFSTGQRDKEHVEPRGGLGRLLLRDARMRAVGNRLLPANARRFLKTRVLGDSSRKPAVPEDVRRRLRHLYADDSRVLTSTIGRELPWTWHR